MDLQLYSDQTLRSLNDAALYREHEKAKIRIEMIIAEMIRRGRTLEAEVRSEFMFQTNMAMRRPVAALGFSLEAPPLRLPSSTFSTRIDTLSLPPLPETEANPKSENKDRLIILARPDQNRFESKRKATVEANDSQSDPFGLKKERIKQEWRCELCKINSTSEKGLKGHLEGKNHKAREEGLKGPKAGNPFLSTLSPSCSMLNSTGCDNDDIKIMN